MIALVQAASVACGQTMPRADAAVAFASQPRETPGYGPRAMALSFRLPLLAGLLLLTPAAADVTLAPLFTDGAVLQRGKPVTIWGAAEPGEKLVVEFSGQRREATAGGDGRWLVMLEPMEPSAEGAELVVAGKTTVRVRDLLVGDVWLCVGEASMAQPLSAAANAAQEIAQARFPAIRQVRIERTVAAAPAETVATSGWRAAAPEHAGTFTAVGYFFARNLHSRVGVPIGLINSSSPDTPIEAWMSPAALASDPGFTRVGERWIQTVAEFPARQAAYEPALAAWQRGEAAAKAQGRSAHESFLRQHARPRIPRGPGDVGTPAGMFNGMINPLLPYAVTGILWSQGDSNLDRPQEYGPLFRALITHWRAHLGQGDLPFFWVSLANARLPGDGPGQSYALLREAQTRALELPHTAQAIAIDLGGPGDPTAINQQEMGRRLALLARNRVYQLVTDDSGPTAETVTRDGAGVRVRFGHASGGLIARDKPVQSLQLAGADRVFHPATGRIERDTVVVTSPAVREPVAVRYAWSNAPEANLYNGAGLPAAPFQLDVPTR